MAICFAVVDIGVPYDTNIDRAVQIMQETALEYAGENTDIVEEPQILGVVDLGDSRIVIRMIAHYLAKEAMGSRKRA